jgi:hypothetical protein
MLIELFLNTIKDHRKKVCWFEVVLWGGGFLALVAKGKCLLGPILVERQKDT